MTTCVRHLHVKVGIANAVDEDGPGVKLSVEFLFFLLKIYGFCNVIE